eukprot:COSAG06_NODE_18250_length_896_cov_1.240903_1_plen_175_part_10
MAYMLERETHGRVCHDIRPYFTAANHFYEARGHGRPWAAKPVRVLCKGYQRARSAASKAEGRKPPNSRVTIPHTVIQRMCEEDERQNAAWKAVFLIMLLTGMRADSVSALQPTNVRFVDGAMEPAAALALQAMPADRAGMTALRLSPFPILSNKRSSSLPVLMRASTVASSPMVS